MDDPCIGAAAAARGGDDVCGLSDTEQATWMAFGAVLELLPAALNSQLAHNADLTQFDYYALRHLADAPENTMRITALAAHTSATLPRMSRVASRLENHGLVERRSCLGDGRATNVTLTPAGSRLLDSATPGYLAAVRSLVIDALSSEQIDQLRGISETLLERLHPNADAPIGRHSAVTEG